ncbi:MAG: tol-pal system YbgF family protein [Phycisphaerales bacterium JB050]
MPKLFHVVPSSRTIGGVLGVSLALGWICPAPVFSQTPRRPTEAPQSEVERGGEQALVARTNSDLLVRALLRRSRNLGSASVADYRLTALGLRLARLQVPDDAELLRNEIAAWAAADDVSRVMDSTRELVRLDPRDTIAQLRLIDAQIGRLNTAEERREAYERLMGPAGERLRGSVRSRLALDAALLAREEGDQQAFLRLMTEATLLDSTNKNAAALYASVMLPTARTRVERFELLANVLLADPLDPGAYENAAIELLSAGAYEASLRFQNRMRELLSASGQDYMSRLALTDPQYFDENRVNDYLIASWQHDGVAEAISFINDAQGTAESRFISQVRELQQSGASMAEIKNILAQQRFPWLPYQLERLRTLMLIGQDEQTRRSLTFTSRPQARDRFANRPDPFGLEGFIPVPPITDALRREIADDFPEATPEQIEQTAAQQVRFARDIDPVHESLTRYMLAAQDLIERMRQNDQIDEQTKSLIEINTTLETIWLLLICENSVDLAENRLDALIQALNSEALDPDAINRYRGWIAANRGDFESARELLTPLAETDASAMYALGMVELRRGDIDESVRLFSRLRVRFPDTALACVARDRIANITGSTPGHVPGSDEVNRYAMRFAPNLERLTRSPREFMSLKVTPTSSTLGLMDRHELVLEVTNKASVPLAVGPSSPIDSRFLFTPRLELEGIAYLDLVRDQLVERARENLGIDEDAPLPDAVQSQIAQQIGIVSRSLLEVVDTDRVLRLEPNETIRVPVWAGRGNIGMLVDRNPNQRITITWSIAQGFVQTQRLGSGARPTQGFTAGPMSLSTQTEMVLRLKLPELSVELLSEQLRNSSGVELAKTILRATSALTEADSEDEVRPLRGALLERMPRLDDRLVAMLCLRLSELGALDRDESIRDALREDVRRRLERDGGLDSPDALTLATTALTTLTRAADDPILRVCMNSSNADLAEFASVFSQILEAGGFIKEEGTDAPEAPKPSGLDSAFDISDTLFDQSGK